MQVLEEDELYEPVVQFSQSVVELIAYLPFAHATHLTPASATVLVVLSVTTAPSPHVSHNGACAPEYSPATQSAQATVAFDEACPAVQAVHFVARGAASVSVTEPVAQVAQICAWLLLYSPAEQLLQLTEPGSGANIPASHGPQYACDGLSWYSPAVHWPQSCRLVLGWKRPASHSEHAPLVM